VRVLASLAAEKPAATGRIEGGPWPSLRLRCEDGRTGSRRRASERRPQAPARLLDGCRPAVPVRGFGGSSSVFDPLQRIGRLFGRGPTRSSSVGCSLARRRPVVSAAPDSKSSAAPGVARIRLPADGPNHQSMFDIPISVAVFRTTRSTSRSANFTLAPALPTTLRRGGRLIDRSDRGQAGRSIRALGESAQARGFGRDLIPRARAPARGAEAVQPGGDHAAPGCASLESSGDDRTMAWRLLCHNLLPCPAHAHPPLPLRDPIPRSARAIPRILASPLGRRSKRRCCVAESVSPLRSPRRNGVLSATALDDGPVTGWALAPACAGHRERGIPATSPTPRVGSEPPGTHPMRCSFIGNEARRGVEDHDGAVGRCRLVADVPLPVGGSA